MLSGYARGFVGLGVLALCVAGCGGSGSGGGSLGREQALERMAALCTPLCAQEARCYDEDPSFCEEECLDDVAYFDEFASDEPEDVACLNRMLRLGRCVRQLNCAQLDAYYDGDPFSDKYPCRNADRRVLDACEDLDWW